MVFTWSIDQFFVCVFSIWDKVFVWVAKNWNILNLECLEGIPICYEKLIFIKIHLYMYWPSSIFRGPAKKLAISCNKTWDHGRREVRSLSSSNTYAKKQVVLIRKIQIKINKVKFTLYLPTSSGWRRLPDIVLIITSLFHTRFDWFKIQMKVY